MSEEHDFFPIAEIAMPAGSGRRVIGRDKAGAYVMVEEARPDTWRVISPHLTVVEAQLIAQAILAGDETVRSSPDALVSAALGLTVVSLAATSPELFKNAAAAKKDREQNAGMKGASDVIS